MCFCFVGKTAQEIAEAVLKDERPEVPYYCPAPYKSEMEACWSPLPRYRPAMSDIIDSIKSFGANAEEWEEKTAIEAKIILKQKTLEERIRTEVDEVAV